MVEESKYCSDLMKKQFNKEFVFTKKDNKDFKNSIICCIWDNEYVHGNFKRRDHSHVTGYIQALHIETVMSKLC